MPEVAAGRYVKYKREAVENDCVLEIAIALWYAEITKWRITARQWEIAAEIRKMVYKCP